MKIARSVVWLWVLAVLANGRTTQADLIIGNIPGVGGSGADLAPLTLGVEFTIGPVSQTLDSATFEIRERDGLTVVAQLQAFDSSHPTVPGVLLQTLIAPPAIGDIITRPVTFTAPTPYTLQADTSYWVTLTTPIGGDFGFTFGDIPTGPGATYVTDYFNDPFFTLHAGIPGFALNSPVVPEPPAFRLMALSGLIGCVALRFQTKQAA